MYLFVESQIDRRHFSVREFDCPFVQPFDEAVFRFDAHWTGIDAIIEKDEIEFRYWTGTNICRHLGHGIDFATTITEIRPIGCRRSHTIRLLAARSFTRDYERRRDCLLRRPSCRIDAIARSIPSFNQPDEHNLYATLVVRDA